VDEKEVFYCAEGCGLTVDQENGTCLACWARIKDEKAGEFQLD
jgi:hypothetical protein